MNLVIVEDHAALRETLVEVLASEGWHVTAFDSAEALLANCSITTIDIAILDLNLPGEDGVSLARKLRLDRPAIGIIMLTARGSPDERRIGYLEGADIYLVKPSSAEELSSAVVALSRRVNQALSDTDLLIFDQSTMILEGRKGRVALSATDTSLIAAFVNAPDRQLTTEAIAALISSDGPASKGAVAVKIVRLRKKLRSAGASGNAINVLRARGFQLCVPVKSSV